MAIRTIYFDESGFTGYNLLDPKQPIFVISGSDIQPDEAEAILKSSFPNYQGKEFKFTNIWAKNHKKGLLKFARCLRDMDAHAFSWMTDKRFGVLTKMVDFLIEPSVTAAGFDFYADGFCWKYANYIHYGICEFGEPELYASLVQNYQAFSREPSPEALKALQQKLSVMASSLDPPVQIFVEQMALGAEVFERHHALENFRGSDELHVTSMLAAVEHWRQRCDEDLAVVHDESAHFFRHREMWDTITSTAAPAGFHVGGDGSEVEFPLRVVSTEAVDSAESYCVQFCDILAGLTAKWFHPSLEDTDRDFLGEVSQAGLETIDYNGVRPSTVFPDQIPPRPLDGPDAIDRFTEIFGGDNG